MMIKNCLNELKRFGISWNLIIFVLSHMAESLTIMVVYLLMEPMGLACACDF